MRRFKSMGENYPFIDFLVLQISYRRKFSCFSGRFSQISNWTFLPSGWCQTMRESCLLGETPPATNQAKELPSAILLAILAFMMSLTFCMSLQRPLVVLEEEWPGLKCLEPKLSNNDFPPYSRFFSMKSPNPFGHRELFFCLMLTLPNPPSIRGYFTFSHFKSWEPPFHCFPSIGNFYRAVE